MTRFLNRRASALGVAVVCAMAGVVACGGGGGGGDAQTLQSAAARCSALATALAPPVTVTTADVVPAGTFQPPTGAAQQDLPEFCRVAGAIQNHPTSRIKFEVWLPTQTANKRFIQVGNGGFAGNIQFGAMAPRLREGYATASTDDGTSAAPGVAAADRLTFLGDLQRLYDFKGRAVTLTTAAAKSLYGTFYEGQPAYSYFTGCSTGGLEALAVAQRIGDQFNGVSAGSPANNSAGLFTQAIWTSRNYARLAGKTDLLHNAVMAACDAKSDGVTDGVIGNPEACNFDPGTLQCTGADTAGCLTADQVDAARKIYEGPVDPRTGTKTGEQYAPGMPRGSEKVWSQAEGQATGASQPWYGMLLHGKLTFDMSQFDFGADVQRALEMTLPYGAQGTNPDLSLFRDKGGKIIMWAGWNDPLWSQGNLVSYYKQVAARASAADPAAALAQTQQFARLFMGPGMGHCGGGDGPNVIDTLTPLVDWVERGKAPDRIVATKNVNNQAAQGVQRARPICGYPLVARWTGNGNPDLAENYQCVSGS
jgi:feruloyl esterase